MTEIVFTIFPFIIFFVVFFINDHIINGPYRKIISSFNKGFYGSALEKQAEFERSELLLSFEKSQSKTKTTKKIATLNYILAVSAFSRNSDELFLKNINLLQNSHHEKDRLFWLTMYHIKNSNLPRAQENWDQLLSLSKVKTAEIVLLEGLLRYKKGSPSEGITLVRNAKLNLKMPILKHIAKQFLETKVIDTKDILKEQIVFHSSLSMERREKQNKIIIVCGIILGLVLFVFLSEWLLVS